jgi:hypothetical protein
MRKYLAFLVLISHMNFFMFIPQVDEADEFDKNGCQLDDINSLYEFIDQVVLGNTDSTPEDEDDDQPRFFHIVKVGDFTLEQNIVLIKRPDLSRNNNTTYPVFLAAKIPLVFSEIQAPPPKI